MTQENSIELMITVTYHLARVMSVSGGHSARLGARTSLFIMLIQDVAQGLIRGNWKMRELGERAACIACYSKTTLLVRAGASLFVYSYT